MFPQMPSAVVPLWRKRALLPACTLALCAALIGCDRKDGSGSLGFSPASASAADQPPSAATQSADGSTQYIPDPEIGREVFVQTCATCHGFQAQGLPHQGAALRTSPFVTAQNDKDLLAFIRKGRPARDPNNKSGVAMPPSGNNPALSDERLLDVVAYLRQVQDEARAETTSGNTPSTSAAK